jgi:plastocyanin
MTRRRTAIAIGLAVTALALAGCGGGDDESAVDTETTTAEATPEAGGTLNASVGPGFEISLTGSDGANVTTVAPGTYTVEVDDQSDMHNFHLTGTGVDESTEVGEVGTATWEVTLQAGSYDFVCDPHAGSMNGSFEVSG